MPITIHRDGSISNIAITKLPNWRRPMKKRVTTKIEILRATTGRNSQEARVQMQMFMPGVISGTIVSTTWFTVTDIRKLIRHALKQNKASKMLQKLGDATLKMPIDTLEGWIKWFLKHLA